MAELHKADQPWKWKKLDSTIRNVDEVQENMVKHVRSILNRITPTNEEKLSSEFILCSKSLYILYTDLLMSLHVASDFEKFWKDHSGLPVAKVVIMILEKAIDEPLYCELYARLCRNMINDDLGTNNVNVSIFRNLILDRVQTAFTITVEADLEQQMKNTREKQRKRRFGNIKLVGHLYLQSVISIRILLFCVLDLLKSVTEKPDDLDGYEADDDSIECAVCLLEIVGKRLQQERDRADEGSSVFPMEMTFQTLKDALPIVKPRTRYLIQNLIELRERRWVPRRAPEVPKKLTEIREELRKERIENEELRRQFELKRAKKELGEEFDDLSDQCKCPVCLEMFDSATFIPSNLSCGHSFCKVCIGKVRINNVIKCPLCKVETVLQNANALPTNFQLLGIADKVLHSKVAAIANIACKMCEKKFSSDEVYECRKKDCNMFKQLICHKCAIQGQHGGHVVNYDEKMVEARENLRSDVADIRTEVENRRKGVLEKVDDFSRKIDALKKRLSEAHIPSQMFVDIDSLTSVEDVSNYRVIVNDLAKKLIDESEATEKEFTQAILTANQQLELVDNQAQSE